MNKSMYTSGKTDWETPQWLFDELNKEFRFDIDVCATKENAKCPDFISLEQNALEEDWYGMCWMNPPYGKDLGKWVKKAYWASRIIGEAQIVALLPARTDTKWFWDYCIHNEIRFLKGRIKFQGAESSAPFPSMIVVFGRYTSGVKFVDIKKQAGITK